MASGAVTIRDVHVAGTVTCSGDGCRVGGLVGEAGTGTIMRASSVDGLSWRHGEPVFCGRTCLGAWQFDGRFGCRAGAAAAEKLKAKNVVILRGRYAAGGGTARHWMLATLFTAASGVTTGVVANDPWTGLQVRIDPATKAVTQPANFPLANFRVDGYRVVTLN